MKRSRMGLLLLVATALVQGTSQTMSADTCSGLSGIQPSQLNDGQLFVLATESNQWILVAQKTPILAPTVNSFLYAVKAYSDGERWGVVVIKSGTRISVPIGVSDKKISLHRDDKQFFDNLPTGCRPMPHFDEPASVTAEEYARYHDDGIAVSGTTLPTYHFTYQTASKVCKATNDMTADSLFDRRSNRSQFSFDDSVVNSGIHYSPLTAFLPFRAPASASDVYAGITNLRVQTIPYRTEGGLACVHFQVPGFDDKSFLRINDLEARLPVPPYARKGEAVWE